ncbi:MAG TPA: hypothetical protein PK096_00140 [Candidatus Saccharibacteria bacterium]|nr:hypothetical protein [Candidatus Saccharibacteria bacterium]HRK93764.1 hypothetical protein [Candidatus Saccharibacteria bacterium]
MKRSLIVLTLALLFTTTAALLMGNPIILQLVEASSFHMGLRAAMMIILIALLVYRPPRSFASRACLLLLASVMSTAAVHQFFSYQLGLIDALVYVEVAIILALEGLESKPKLILGAGLPPRSRKIPVRYVT